MHTTKTSTATFIHNGDYSGEVIIVLPSSAVKKTMERGIVHVEVDFEAIKELVANYVRDNRISKLEMASADEVLGGTDDKE